MSFSFVAELVMEFFVFCCLGPAEYDFRRQQKKEKHRVGSPKASDSRLDD